MSEDSDDGRTRLIYAINDFLIHAGLLRNCHANVGAARAAADAYEEAHQGKSDPGLRDNVAMEVCCIDQNWMLMTEASEALKATKYIPPIRMDGIEPREWIHRLRLDASRIEKLLGVASGPFIPKTHSDEEYSTLAAGMKERVNQLQQLAEVPERLGPAASGVRHALDIFKQAAADLVSVVQQEDRQSKEDRGNGKGSADGKRKSVKRRQTNVKPITAKQTEASKLYGIHNGNITRVAEVMGISRQSAREHIEKAKRKLQQYFPKPDKALTMQDHPHDPRGQAMIGGGYDAGNDEDLDAKIDADMTAGKGRRRYFAGT